MLAAQCILAENGSVYFLPFGNIALVVGLIFAMKINKFPVYPFICLRTLAAGTLWFTSTARSNELTKSLMRKVIAMMSWFILNTGSCQRSDNGVTILALKHQDPYHCEFAS
jgi:hypothetical protein